MTVPQVSLVVRCSLTGAGARFDGAFRHIKAPMISMNRLTIRANTMNTHSGRISVPRNIITPATSDPRPPRKPAQPSQAG